MLHSSEPSPSPHGRPGPMDTRLLPGPGTRTVLTHHHNNRGRYNLRDADHAPDPSLTFMLHCILTPPIFHGHRAPPRRRLSPFYSCGRGLSVCYPAAKFLWHLLSSEHGRFPQADSVYVTTSRLVICEGKEVFIGHSPFIGHRESYSLFYLILLFATISGGTHLPALQVGKLRSKAHSHLSGIKQLCKVMPAAEPGRKVDQHKRARREKSVVCHLQGLR